MKLNLISFSLILTFVFLSIATNAQNSDASRLRLDIGLNGGVSTGNAHKVSNVMLGGTARLQYELINSINLTFTSGYFDFMGKAVPEVSDIRYESITLIPAKGGVKVFFLPGYYFLAEGGVGFETVAGGDIKIIIAPTIGFKRLNWDLGLDFERFSGSGVNYSFVGLRLAYGFGLSFVK